MKRLIILTPILFLVLFLFSCKRTPSVPQKSSEQIHFEDSVRNVRKFKDSLLASGVVERIKPNLIIKTDEFRRDADYYHKNIPENRTGKYVSLFFNQYKDKPSDGVLYFLVNYDASDWLSMKGGVFDIDGDTIKIGIIYFGIIYFRLAKFNIFL